MSFGTGSANSETLLSETVTSNLNSPHDRQRLTILNSSNGTQTLSAHVVNAGSGSDYKARFNWKGFAVCTE